MESEGESVERAAEQYLLDWKDRCDRKPLIVRGARQVGKTYLVEVFGRSAFESVLTVNLERRDDLHAVFDRLDPSRIVQDLSLAFDVPVTPGRTLLFFDEIQTCPRAIAALRYFREEMPDLHVIAAGSLLDFALRELPHSMPVGRIEYLSLHPLSFREFLWAVGERRLAHHLAHYHLEDELGPAVSAKLRELARLYFFIGGMPAAVDAYALRGDLIEVQRTHASMLGTLQDDFAKYGTRAQQRNMRRVLRYMPRGIGRKVRFVNISREASSADLRTALELLELSRVVTLVRHTSANGIPLGAEASEKHLKPLLLDVGLCTHLSGADLPHDAELLTAQEGALAEQFVGQELRTLAPPFEDRTLYYWHREARSANAEVDYLWTHKGEVIPVEVRAGASGSLKSTLVFLAEKRRRVAVRFNMDAPTIGSFAHAVGGKAGDRPVQYTLLSLPVYLVDQLDRLLGEVI